MAQQNSDSFIYRLIVRLQDDNALAELSQSIGRLSEVTTQADGRISNLAQSIRQQLGKAGDKSIKGLQDRLDAMVSDLSGPAESAVQDLRQSLNRLEQAGADRPFDELKSDVRDVLTSVQRLSAADVDININEVVRDATKLEGVLEQVEDAQAGVNQQMKQTGRQPLSALQGAQRQMRRTSQTSQNLLRILQDAPFGILGVANNIQALGEDLSRASTQGRGMLNQLKQGFKSLLAGPFAIPAAITAVTVLAQIDLGELIKGFNKFIDRVKVLVGLLDESTKNVRDLRDTIQEGLNPEVSDFLQSLEDLEGEDRQEAISIISEGLRRSGRAANSAKTALTAYRQSLSESTRIMLENDTASKEVMRTFEILEGRLEDARRQLLFWEQANDSLIGTQIRRLNLTKEIINQLGIQSDLTRGLTQFFEPEDGEDAEEAGEERAENVADATRLIFEKQNSLIRDEVQRTYRQIELETDEEIASLREKFSNQPDMLDQLIGLTRLQEKKEKWQAFLNQEGFLQPSDVEPGEAFVQDTDSFKIAFGLTPSEFTQQARRSFEIANQSLQAQIDSVRRRQNLAEEQRGGESILGGFLTISPEDRKARMQRLNEQLQQEQQLRQRQLQERIEMQRAMLRVEAFQSGPRSDQAMRIKNNISNLEQQKANIEEQFYRKRLENQREFQRQRAKGILTAGTELTSRTSSVASDVFNIWLEKRQQDLENQGKTQEQQRKILEREGKKRFQFMKAMKIANTVATGISSAHEAWERGMEIPFAGGPVLAAAFTATSLAQTALRVRQLSNLSIGDKLPGGGAGSGGGLPGGNFTQLSGARAANRAANMGVNVRQQQQNQENGEMARAAEKIDGAADKIQDMQVTMSERASLRSQDQANVAREKFRK